MNNGLVECIYLLHSPITVCSHSTSEDLFIIYFAGGWVLGAQRGCYRLGAAPCPTLPHHPLNPTTRGPRIAPDPGISPLRCLITPCLAKSDRYRFHPPLHSNPFLVSAAFVQSYTYPRKSHVNCPGFNITGRIKEMDLPVYPPRISNSDAKRSTELAIRTPPRLVQ